MLAGATVVYGGSFNPPHVGHQMACLYLLEALGAQRVWLMPAFVHAFGKPLAPFAHRVAMCELLAKPFAGRVTVSELEKEAGSGRTYDVLTLAKSRQPELELALAIGSDLQREVASWHRFEEVEKLARLVVIGRGGYPNGAPVALPEVSSSQVREAIADGRSIEGLVPASVAAYVREHGLYRGAS